MKQKKTIHEKIQAELPDFAAEVANLSGDQLNNRLAKLAKDSEANEQAKEEDEDLLKAKEKVQLYSEPYKEFKKVLRLKMKYVIALAEERGTTVDKKDKNKELI
jgi:hypothetical protein